MIPVTDLDLSGSDGLGAADPYPALARLRQLGPLVRHQPTGMLLATTHAAVGGTLRQRALGRVWRDREPAGTYEPFNALHRHQMMENEPPAHTRLRRLVAGAFARGHVERMRPRIAAIADRLLDQLAGAAAGGPVDLVGGYAEPLPVAVIADLLGVPAVDRPLLRDWSQAIVAMYEYDRGPEVEAAAVRASAEFAAYVRDLVAERRRRPGADLLTDLVRETDGGRTLCEEELVASVVLLLNAGHEASVNAFGNGPSTCCDTPTSSRGSPLARCRCRPRSRSCCGTTRRCSCSSVPAPRTSSCWESRCRPGLRWQRCWGRPTGTLRCSTNRTGSTSAATPTRTWASGWGCTSASARRWHGWSW